MPFFELDPASYQNMENFLHLLLNTVYESSTPDEISKFIKEESAKDYNSPPEVDELNLNDCTNEFLEPTPFDDRINQVQHFSGFFNAFYSFFHSSHLIICI